ncbi:hypothetical protein QUF75_18420 [Desulfococcaceae bacterium HSG7]|nr:hypothetical protein [Desulfococcaceae bacterium HSG7]
MDKSFPVFYGTAQGGFATRRERCWKTYDQVLKGQGQRLQGALRYANTPYISGIAQVK